ncbi:MAG: acyl-CoA dehydrogenase family protein [Gemmatimonadaceae bacterium]
MRDDPLDWPFFTDEHRTFAGALRSWSADLPDTHPADVDAECKSLVRQLGDGGWLRHVVPAAYGGATERLDVRTLCLAREILARRSGLAESAFAMQGLGAGPIAMFGSDQLKERYLPPVALGDVITGFAISESEAGSDVAAMRTTARHDGDAWIIDGEKTWISNAGIADWYVVFCRVEGAERKFVALVVEASDLGFEVTGRIEAMAPHPLGTLRFDGCRVPADRLVGDPEGGLKVALGTLDVFRSAVGAAAVGFARRALDEALRHVTARKVFGQVLADMQLTQARIARMATDIDAAALLVYRAAWTRDSGAARITREAAMAKMFATEMAQRVIDDALQLLGGRGVVAHSPVEQLYREIRALRIYEGTTEIQQLVIAGQVLGAYKDGAQTGND